MKYIGGYSILDLTDANVSAQANVCYNQDKPVLVYGANGEKYFADTITKSGTNIIITKGGKTITIANDNTITSTGTVSAPTMENIKDLDGRLRFIEGDLDVTETTGVTYKYAKWSLSGTHLMISLAFDVANATVLSSVVLTNLASSIPQWILDKLIPIAGNRYDFKSFSGYTSDLTQVQSLSVNVAKTGTFYNLICSAFTASYDLGYKIQFDFLIDADYSE